MHSCSSKLNTTALFSVSELQLISRRSDMIVCASIALVMEVVLPYRKSKVIAYFALIGIALAASSLGLQWWYSRDVLPLDGFYGMVRIDGFALLFKSIFLVAAALAIGISTRYLDIEGEQHGEYYALILFAAIGMMFLACGYDLILLFISLELMALTFYVLVAFTKREKRSNEAAMSFPVGLVFRRFCCMPVVALRDCRSTNLGEIDAASARLLAQ